MYDPNDGDDGRIDDDHREASPSTGWRETTIICGGELPDDRPEDLL